MCYHKKAIFTTCGHSSWGPLVGSPCSDTNSSQSPSRWQTCKKRSHPFRTLRIDTLCPHCNAERERLLAALETEQVERKSAGAWPWKELVPRLPTVNLMRHEMKERHFIRRARIGDGG